MPLGIHAMLRFDVLQHAHIKSLFIAPNELMNREIASLPRVQKMRSDAVLEKLAGASDVLNIGGIAAAYRVNSNAPLFAREPNARAVADGLNAAHVRHHAFTRCQKDLGVRPSAGSAAA